MVTGEILPEHSSNVECSKEGTSHQAKLGPESKRKHFFAQVDSARADAVHRDAENVEYSIEEERVVKRKIDNTVLPLVICSYVFNQFDRTNIGNAHVIPAYNQNYGITNNNKWTLALSIFYVGYCLLEMPANSDNSLLMPSNVLYSHLVFSSTTTYWRQSVLLPFSYVLGFGFSLRSICERIPWSTCSEGIDGDRRSRLLRRYDLLSVLLVQTVRLQSIYPMTCDGSMLHYYGLRSELAMRISLCMTGTLPGAIGGLLAFGLVRAHTSILQGWQFLFLIEAIPTLVMAVMILFFLPSFPFSATFLSPRERAIAQARVNRDHKPQSHGGMTGWSGFKAVVADINSWLFMLVYASFNVGVATITYFLPTLIKNLGFTSINAQGLTVAPYLVGWFLVVLQAWHSDRTRDRGWHIMASTATAFVGYVILATSVQKSVGAAYFALFLVVGGNFSLFPLVMSWAANAFSPTSKRGVGTAFIVSISNCVSIASPQIYFDPEDDFRKGHAISAGCLLLSFLVAFILRTRLTLLNKRNAARLSLLSENEKHHLETTSGEIWDDDPRYVFVT